MATHPSVLPGESQGRGHTESDTTEVTQQQQCGFSVRCSSPTVLPQGLGGPTFDLEGSAVPVWSFPWRGRQACATAALLPSDRQSWEVIAGWDLVYILEDSQTKSFSGYLDKRDLFCFEVSFAHLDYISVTLKSIF